jgi:GNAT superfamily N-acetyltransferase
MSEDPNVVTLPCTCLVRPARPCDSNAMAGLALQLGYACTGEAAQKRLSQMQDPDHYAVFVAELSGGQIAGWIGAYLFRSVETDSCAGINGLVVDQNFRSSGIGKRLVDAAEEWARRIRCHAISVRSNITRDRAHRFYTNNGYEHVMTQREFRKNL